MDKQTKMAFALGGSVDLDTVPDNTKGIDPVSGNEVPIGSTAKEVRDDIPAQLSEGEYVVPSDVVRFYGVRFFENLRAKAKFGYRDMADNGRIGGEPVDEPDMDMMFDISELEVEDDGEPIAMADGGYALSPGDEGYATMGALGLGSEGISAGYEVAGSAPTVEVRTYVNEAGHTIYITFIDGNPQTSIPPGYTLQEETTADTTTTAATTAQPEPQVVTPSGRDRRSTPMPTPKAINYKELTTEEIAKMLEDQTSAKSTAISIGAGAINPVLGLFVKGAMMDSARRLENEIERRIASEEYAGDKQVLEDMLKASKEGKPGLIQKIFGAVKDAFVPETQEEAEALEIAMQMDTGDVTQFEGDINLDVDPIIKTQSNIPTEAEIIAPTTGKVSTYVDPVTREQTKFESYGQVTRNGVYAGDGFEWYEMKDEDGKPIKSSDGAPVLGRRYTKEGEDNGLGQDTIVATELGYGDPSDREVFVKIADISLEEGSEFASKPGSANDGDFLEFLRTGSFGASESYAEQEGKDFTPTLTYGDALAKVKDTKPYVPETVDAGSSSTYVPISPELETQMSDAVDSAALSFQEQMEVNRKRIAEIEANEKKRAEEQAEADRQAQAAAIAAEQKRDSERTVVTPSQAASVSDVTITNRRDSSGRSAGQTGYTSALRERKSNQQQAQKAASSFTSSRLKSYSSGRRPSGGFDKGGIVKKPNKSKKK
jgi:hypothetical protein